MKKSILFSIASLISAPILGTQVISCGFSAPSKSTLANGKLKTSNEERYIFIDSSSIEPNVRANKKTLDTTGKFNLVVDPEFVEDWRVIGIQTLWSAGKTYTSNDFTTTLNDNDLEVTIKESILLTITNPIYIVPIVQPNTKFNYSLIGDFARRVEIDAGGITPRYFRQFNCSVTIKSDERNKYSLGISQIYSGEKLLHEGTDYTVTQEGNKQWWMHITIKKDVIDGNITVKPVMHNIGINSVFVNVYGKRSITMQNYIASEDTQVKIDNPLITLGFEERNKITKAMTVKAKIGGDPISPEDITVNDDFIVVKIDPDLEKDLTLDIDVTPISSLAAKQCFEQDSWNSMLSIMDWSEYNEQLFCKVYQANALSDFLNAQKQVVWGGMSHRVDLVATKYHHLAITTGEEYNDNQTDKLTWFTFKFMNPITHKTKGVIIDHFEDSIGSDNNYNCWFYRHYNIVTRSSSIGMSLARRFLSDTNQVHDTGKFSSNFENKNFLNHVKTVANYSYMTSVHDSETGDPKMCYIRDRFFLPSAVQLGMKPTSQERIHCEPEDKKPVFDAYKDQQRWEWNWTEAQMPDQIKERLKAYKLDGSGSIAQWLITPASSDTTFGETEKVCFIRAAGILGRQKIDLDCTYLPCFCI